VAGEFQGFVIFLKCIKNKNIKNIIISS